MNRPNDFTLFVTRGATLAVEAELKDRYGSPVPFGAGWSGAAQVRTKPGGDLLLTLAVVLGAADGIVVVSASKAATAAMPASPARAAWDLLVTDPEDNVWPLLAGEVSITSVVTVL